MASPDNTTSEQPPHMDEKTARQKIPIIRTYQTDIAETIRKKNLSLASIAMMEQRNREVEKGGVIGAQRKSLRAVLFLGVLVLLSVIGGWFAFTLYQSQTRYEPPQIGVIRVLPIIFVEKQTEVHLESLRRSSISEKLQNSVVEQDALVGSMVNLYLTEGTPEANRLVSAERLFSMLEAHTPQALIRALKPEFMFGAHVFSGNRPFFIFKINAFDIAFSEMLRWERDLPYDLALVFGIHGNGASTKAKEVPITSSTTSVETISPPSALGVSLYSKQFTDIVLFNKDIRVLKNDSGNIVLLYVFPDRETLIIADNEETLREILYRLTALQSVNEWNLTKFML